MKADSRSRRAPALIALLLSAAMPALAQEVAPPPTPSADKLAEEMRALARNPRDVRALLSAGELSARLNDPAAAAGFFARAQALDPSNPRVQAGQAMVMVRKERPGEALRLFADAERRGLSMEPYASDRGLAYDLVGARAHALRDHEIAMRRDPDDEAVRRYALSLGISGRSEEAMRVLDPLLRRSDRAGWRARAFILAMNGDAAGADKIAASMMGGVGTALAPFFRRLPSLSAADKAFAVHFGELRRTPARIADAQLAPPLSRLGQEAGVAVAAAEAPRSAPTPTSAPAKSPRPGTTSRFGEGRSVADRGRARQTRELEARRAAEQAEARRSAQAEEAKRLAEQKAQQEREALAARQREAERLAAEQAREAEARRVAEAQRTAEAQRLAEAQQAPVPQPASAPAPAPGFETVSPAAASASETVPARAADAAPAAPRIGGEDNVIARIIAGITIPASELGVEPMPGRAPAADPPAAVPAAAPPVELAKAAPPAPQPQPEAAKPEPAKPRGRDKAAEAADAKATAKPAKGKPAAKAKPKPDPAKTDPARHWVQVAGGANAGDLDRAWRKLVDKSPAEFRGKQAWTTPLRFTNRLLTGPFKTSAEAQAFVNLLAKKGVSAFAWTSEAGQKIEKLSVK